MIEISLPTYYLGILGAAAWGAVACWALQRWRDGRKRCDLLDALADAIEWLDMVLEPYIVSGYVVPPHTGVMRADVERWTALLKKYGRTVPPR